MQIPQNWSDVIHFLGLSADSSSFLIDSLQRPVNTVTVIESTEDKCMDMFL